MYGSKAFFWSLAVWGGAGGWACGKVQEDMPQPSAAGASAGALSALSQSGSAGLTGAAGNAGVVGDAGAAGNAGAAGDAGAAGTAGAPPLEDYAHARWPMPNAVSSGLPHPASYAVTSASVVTDTVTGLHWQRAVAPSDLDFASALAGCEALSLDGHAGWRLPSRIELSSLFAAGQDWNAQSSPFADLDAVHWSSSLEVSLDGTGASHVNPARQEVEDDALNLKLAVRCVRSEPNPERAAYVVAPQTVRDTGTGLLWQRAVRGLALTLAAAEEQCASLSLDGQSGFRVPSLQELVSIADVAHSSPAFDPTVFSDEAGDVPVWSATPQRDFSFAVDGVTSYPSVSIEGFTSVRCVR
jgi:hypothetical protein